eukprot:NODE_12135_length_1243_cov_17.192652.p1 GENE.NODE_12135_length_1243_cov_17.192652~~NODE_12135_length_1243_cov_17.192652.p1  ORF type:complete len:279 (+),score=85.92 NODE_12135_length_1243_cov_17.192652:115-951(+)
MATTALRSLRPACGTAGIGALAAAAALAPPAARCEDKDPPHPPTYPFWFKSMLHSMDIPSVRRGYEVYRNVCATCHSMKQIHFRYLVNQVYPEKRMKQFAETFDVVDGPNDIGEMYERPAILTDAFPSPYPNEEAARYANGGANPPDLSVLTTAKHEGVDFIFALLNGYRPPPVGVTIREGLYYNPYYPGGVIGMPPPLSDDGQVDYEDGTAATRSQMAKDVVEFLTWASEPTHDERKLIGLKGFSGVIFATFVSIAWYRTYMIGFKTRRIDFVKPAL